MAFARDIGRNIPDQLNISVEAKGDVHCLEVRGSSKWEETDLISVYECDANKKTISETLWPGKQCHYQEMSATFHE